jgi:pilus assembly protein CpaF
MLESASGIAQQQAGSREQRLQQLKGELHEQLLASVDFTVLRSVEPEVLRTELRRGAERLCSMHSDLLNQADRSRLIDELVDETLGLGPLESLMHDPTVSDILINGPSCVYVERRGILERTNIAFRSLEHLLEIIQRIVGRVGRRIDESSPMVDARLPDGSRLNAVIKPLALEGALVSIRRFAARPLTSDDLVARRTATPQMIEFLAACVRSRLNVLISGGTGSGKTTLLNMLSGFIPNNERIATIEDAAELRFQHSHVARMETRPPSLEGKGEVTTRELLKNALRMRPDRIIVGECRGAEAFDMLQAMNTGHDGGMSTIHANDTRDALSRLEMLIGMAAPELPMWFIHRQIASAIHIVVQVCRLASGERKIVQISEVTGMHGESINMHDLFMYRADGIDDHGKCRGKFEANGIVPNCMAHFEARGITVDRSVFDRNDPRQLKRSDYLRAM